MTSQVFIIGTKYNRAGADDDIKTITNTFQELFNSEVHNWIDLEDKKELNRRMDELKTSETWSTKFREAEFVVIFCMAHGSTDGMVQLFKSDEIKDVKRALLNPFFKIEELDKKLKWLVVQSCRGNLNDLDLQTDGKKKQQKYYLDHYCISYCTEEGTISYQEDTKGKVYLQTLCKELRDNANTETLDNMLKNIGTTIEKFAEDKSYENFSKPNYVKNTDLEYKFFK